VHLVKKESMSTGTGGSVGSGAKQRACKTESKEFPPDADICSIKCREQACDIQWCLQNNNHQQSRCEHVIRKWKDCCDAAKSQQKVVKPK
jgi:hypothetical protein